MADHVSTLRKLFRWSARIRTTSQIATVSDLLEPACPTRDSEATYLARTAGPIHHVSVRAGVTARNAARSSTRARAQGQSLGRQSKRSRGCAECRLTHKFSKFRVHSCPSFPGYCDIHMFLSGPSHNYSTMFEAGLFIPTSMLRELTPTPSFFFLFSEHVTENPLILNSAVEYPGKDPPAERTKARNARISAGAAG